MSLNTDFNDTIIALATPNGVGAISVIRLSGNDAITIAERFFKSVSGKRLSEKRIPYILVISLIITKLLMKFWFLFLKIQILIQAKM